jgi:hypothetical protein
VERGHRTHSDVDVRVDTIVASADGGMSSVKAEEQRWR